MLNNKGKSIIRTLRWAKIIESEIQRETGNLNSMVTEPRSILR